MQIPKHKPMMMQVQDLRIEEDVLPFFNFTNNVHAENALLHMLRTAPETEAAVEERICIIKGIRSNWAVLEQFTYRRLDLMEVHAFLENIAGTGLAYRQGKLRAWLRLKVFEAERTQLEAKLVQLILLLHGLQRQYFTRLSTTTFPDSFKLQLLEAVAFLRSLNLETYAGLVHERRFRTRDIVAFAELLATIAPQQVKDFWQFFFRFEAYWSVARAIEVHGFEFATFSNGSFRIADFYHPVVKQPVKNTIDLDTTRNVVLLTGPNMSGKSTLLKAISLCVYLSRVGFPVPAAACTVPFFQTVSVAINLNDNLRDGYSHFMTEIQNLKMVLHATRNGHKCFAVFDELFRGTNVDDALDITTQTINGLATFKNSYFFVSTHLLELEEQLETERSQRIKKYFIACNLQKGVPTFTYKLQEGWSQLRIGRILFEQEGLSRLLEVQHSV
ncbi:MAG TPA: AAA family ATPase [Pontibacter sp.]